MPANHKDRDAGAVWGRPFHSHAEARADQDYKRMLIESAAADIAYTPVVGGIPADFLRESLTRNGYVSEVLAGAGSLSGAGA